MAPPDDIDKLRVLVANEPRSYREAIAVALQALKPDVEVIDVEPEKLDHHVKRLAPHLVICSRLTPVAEASIFAWIELYPGHGASSRVSLGGERSTLAEAELADLLSIIERTETLTKVGRDPP